MPAVWTVQRTDEARFLFRIAIEQDGRTLFPFRAKAAWPGAGTQVFCLREREPPATSLETVELACDALRHSRTGGKALR